MKCSRMKLTDRNEIRNKKEIQNTGCDVCGDLTNKRSYDISLAPWQKRTISSERRSASLAISELVLPSNLTLKKSPGAQRWQNRRPRLRSSKSKTIFHRPKTEVIELSKQSSEETDEDSSLENTLKAARISLESSIDYDIDENVMKLIEEAEEFDKRSVDCEKEESYRKRKKKKRKKRRKTDLNSNIAELDNLGITKQVTLSRPISPATEQVIRVDVVSTFSVEENVDSDLSVEGTLSSRETSALPMVTITPKSGNAVVCPELTVRCQRLRLSNRKRNNADRTSSKTASHVFSAKTIK